MANARFFSVVGSLSLCLGGGSWAFAEAEAEGWSTETSTSSPSPKPSAASDDRSVLKEELRRELLEELREEFRTEIEAQKTAAPAAATPGAEDDFGEFGSDALAEEEWKWDEPTSSSLNFLEIDGYFRFRYDMFHNLDLNTYYQNTETGQESGPFAVGYAPPVPACNTDIQDRGQGQPGDANYRPPANSCGNRNDGSTLGGANMRLRLEPTINVYEDAQIKMQVDVLDNVVFGSTPDGFPPNPLVPFSGLSNSQNTLSDGVTGLDDAIQVKRVWAEVMTPLGQLRVGRMPDQFGMSAFMHDGSGIDQDFGNTVDRIAFATEVGDFLIVPGFDWVATGPTSAIRFDPLGQPFDRDQKDDVAQYHLTILRKDNKETIDQMLANDEVVLNYGLQNRLRFQGLDAANYFLNGDPTAQSRRQTFVRRDLQQWQYSMWFKMLWRKLLFETEYTGIVGKVGNAALAGGYDTAGQEISLSQHGVTANLEYKFLKDSLTVQLLFLYASGDSAPGWGLRPLWLTSGTRGTWDGTQVPAGDSRITNFRFNPDYVVDMILWRQLVGAVTDAIVIRPGVQYNLTEALGARLDVVYSRAVKGNSTPSGSFSNLAGRAPLGEVDNNLGLETDLKLFFESERGFHVWLQYGIFFPFAGLNREVVVETGRSTVFDADGAPIQRLDAAIAQTIQVLLALSF
jgi:uncharacterized protein (TIGR04551 family)